MNRLSKIDEIRGYTLISMILYHFMWDLKYLAGFEMNWYTGPLGTIWQQSICISFILISGFSFSLGKRHLKRSLSVFVAGIIVSVVTLALMPENRIVFGILTFMGSAGLIMIPLSRLHYKLEELLDKWTLNFTMLIGSFLLFIVFYNINDGFLRILGSKMQLPKYMYKGYVMTYFGYTDPTFYSTDYFSILPWIFMYLFGFYLYRVLCLNVSKDGNGVKKYKIDDILNKKVSKFFERERCQCVAFIGRNTLIIYMLHQPILYLLTLLIQQI